MPEAPAYGKPDGSQQEAGSKAPDVVPVGSRIEATLRMLEGNPEAQAKLNDIYGRLADIARQSNEAQQQPLTHDYIQQTQDYLRGVEREVSSALSQTNPPVEAVKIQPIVETTRGIVGQLLQRLEKTSSPTP